MIVSLKDGFKLIGISIMACCAVCVCNMFLNFQIDLRSIANQVEAGPAQALYDAFVNTSIVCCACCGGCMLITSVVMLFFYIKHYIDRPMVILILEYLVDLLSLRLVFLLVA